MAGEDCTTCVRLQRSPDLAVGDCELDVDFHDDPKMLQRSPDLAVGDCYKVITNAATVFLLQRSPDLAVGD